MPGAPSPAPPQPTVVTDDGTTKVYAVGGGRFVVPAYFDVYKFLGAGSYGQVCAAVDQRDGRKVAIKRVMDIINNDDSRRVTRELRVLSSMQHKNVLRLRTVLPPSEPQLFTDLYLVTELLDQDLRFIVRSRQVLSNAHCQYLTAQLLRALKYIHSANVVHRDIKPENLLVDSRCRLVLSDFGLARTIDGDHAMTSHLVTRWYRAPELLVMQSRYSYPVDVWSAGCIFAELLLRRPLFTGETYLSQLSVIIHALGRPSEDELEHVPEEARRHIERSFPASRGVGLPTIIPSASDTAIDFVQSMLQFDPRRRATAAAALAHPFLEKLHKPEDEPSAPFELHLDDGETTQDLSDDEIRSRLLDLVEEIHTHETFDDTTLRVPSSRSFCDDERRMSQDFLASLPASGAPTPNILSAGNTPVASAKSRAVAACGRPLADTHGARDLLTKTIPRSAEGGGDSGAPNAHA